MLALRRAGGHKPAHRPPQPQVEQVHVGDEGQGQDPDAVGQVPQMVHHVGRQKKADQRGDCQRDPVRKHVLHDALYAWHKKFRSPSCDQQ